MGASFGYDSRSKDVDSGAGRRLRAHRSFGVLFGIYFLRGLKRPPQLAVFFQFPISPAQENSLGAGATGRVLAPIAVVQDASLRAAGAHDQAERDA